MGKYPPSNILVDNVYGVISCYWSTPMIDSQENPLRLARVLILMGRLGVIGFSLAPEGPLAHFIYLLTRDRKKT